MIPFNLQKTYFNDLDFRCWDSFRPISNKNCFSCLWLAEKCCCGKIYIILVRRAQFETPFIRYLKLTQNPRKSLSYALAMSWQYKMWVRDFGTFGFNLDIHFENVPVRKMCPQRLKKDVVLWICFRIKNFIVPRKYPPYCARNLTQTGPHSL